MPLTLLLSTLMSLQPSLVTPPSTPAAPKNQPPVAVSPRRAPLEGVTDAAYPWSPDQRDGTYRNPVLHADYSDPDVIRDGNDYWLTASSFTNTPGLPILHSKDLVNWKLVNHAIKKVPNPTTQPTRYDAVLPGCGVWAPAIRKHNGLFYIFFPTPDEGIYVTTAKDPAGEWSAPWLLLGGKGLIDPCPLWDDDGNAYLAHAYANSRAGIKHKLRIRPMSPDAKTILGDGQIVYDGVNDHPTLEGPKFHKKDGYYYLSAPGGSVPTGWQVIFRSKNVYGPYEDKIVLAQQDTVVNGPHQGALVDDTAGGWWFLHFQDVEQYGRIVHLQPVAWKDNWPIPGDTSANPEKGKPVLRHKKPPGDSEVAVPATSDDFNDAKLGLQWQWGANPKDGWYSLTDNPGHLRLFAAPAPADFNHIPQLLGQKFPARSFSLTTKFSLNAKGDAEAGLAVIGRSSAALLLEQRGDKTQLALHLPKQDALIQILDANTVELKVMIDENAKAAFAYRTDTGDFKPLGPQWETVVGQWVGTRIGLVARSATPNAGHADFDYFRFSAR